MAANGAAVKRRIRDDYEKLRKAGKNPNAAWTQALDQNMQAYVQWLRSVGADEQEICDLLHGSVERVEARAAKERSLAKLAGRE